MQRRRFLLASALACAAYFALRHADLFHLIAMQSPALQTDLSIVDAYGRSERLPLKIFMQVGTMNDLTQVTRLLRGVLQEKGYPLCYLESPEGHSYGNWRGSLDEMLVYFFGGASGAQP